MDFLVTSHLRWNFVFQRPQHLMTRCAQNRRVFFWEEPIFDSEIARLEIQDKFPGLRVITPHLPVDLDEHFQSKVLEKLMQELVCDFNLRGFVLWYYTPLAVAFTQRLKPRIIVYDCMDELSGFRGASPGLYVAENQVFAKADLVFTGGQSLYDAKKNRHEAVHCFPSSIDKHFFMSARTIQCQPADQSAILGPKIGYCGVIDERMDLELLANLADSRPEWQIVMIGPAVKIGFEELPKRPNIHYLGEKPYQKLPSYFAGWEVGLLPFARNDATRYISPTKIPEYLAAGLPVVSTSITDVVNPYGVRGFASIADSPAEFVESVENAMKVRRNEKRIQKIDEFLASMSWDQTWDRMYRLIVDTAARKGLSHASSVLSKVVAR